MKILLSVVLGLFSGLFAVAFMSLFNLGTRFGGVVSEEVKRSERWLRGS
jgi:hypothetical protein